MMEVKTICEHGREKEKCWLAHKLEERGYPGISAGHMFNMHKAAEIIGNPAVWVDGLADNKLTLEIDRIPNDQAMRIVRDVLPKVLELYLNKSRDYGGNVMDMINLGPKASFVDLWRKVGKLKRALWDEQPMVGEQADEILMDLIGHILIILDGMNRAEA